MEKHINDRVAAYLFEYKTAMQAWLTEGNQVVLDPQGNAVTGEFLRFMYDYDALQFCKEDFQIRVRVKNPVPHHDLCLARRANQEQCTRRKGAQLLYCGTHLKGQPHGVMPIEGAGLLDTDTNALTKVEVWVQEIMGINYYIDAGHNVYRADEVLANKHRPAVIAKWAFDAGVGYTIPALCQ